MEGTEFCVNMEGTEFCVNVEGTEFCVNVGGTESFFFKIYYKEIMYSMCEDNLQNCSSIQFE